MNAIRTAFVTWRRLKTPLMLAVACLFTGAAYFGLTTAAGALPYALWFATSSWFWPLWLTMAGGIGLLAAVWVLSIHFAPPSCC